MKYDFRLDEGCAWPDVPCGNEDSIETCYYDTWRNEHKKGTLAYESHHGSKQFWHSMAPTGKNTNKQVVNLIVDQAKKWFKKGLDVSGDDGLFHIGKILHMVQDSYSLSHVQRHTDNKVIQFQSYEAQDPDKHGNPDKDGESKGAQDAFLASVSILTFYKGIKEVVSKESKKEEKERITNNALLELEKYFTNSIYPILGGRENIIAGGSLEAYKKKTEKQISPSEKK
ncbi:hypothetical protein [Flavobacterium davisii]|uniref:hypothetical protein n=1 Tax=Flavobacterium davisii TaxID=2906077 RepID=UPI0035CE9700